MADSAHSSLMELGFAFAPYRLSANKVILFQRSVFILSRFIGYDIGNMAGKYNFFGDIMYDVVVTFYRTYGRTRLSSMWIVLVCNILPDVW